MGRHLWRPSGAGSRWYSRATRSHLPRTCVQMAFEYLQGWRLRNLSGQPVPVLSHPHSKKVLPAVLREPPVFQSVPAASGPVTGHHWKEPGSVLFAPSLQVFMYIDKISLSRLFSELNSPRSLGPFSCEMPQSLQHLYGPLSDSLQYVHVSLTLESPELGTVLQVWPDQC